MRTRWKSFTCIAAFVASLLSVSSALALATYTATRLPFGTLLRNNNGVLVTKVSASVGTSSQTTTMSIIKSGVTTAVYISPAGTLDNPNAINDANVVVGERWQSPGPGLVKTHAMIFSNGIATDLHPAIAAAFGLDGAATSSFAKDINNAGEIVGMISTSTAGYPFLYKGGVVTDLRTATGAPLDSAEDVNNLGQITGMMGYPNSKAYIYSPGGEVRSLEHANSLVNVSGRLINDAGQVAGTLTFPTSHPPPVVHAFFYEGGALKDIGPNPDAVTIPTGMNGAGAVVGFYNVDNYGFFGFVYRDGVIQELTGMVDSVSLNGSPITEARSINDDGAIFAVSNGTPVLLQPITPSADPAIFNFEVGTQGWETAGQPIITLSNSATPSYAGGKSLGIHFNENGFASVRVLNPSVQPGQTITFHVYLPADSKIEWLQPFGLGGAADNWAWSGNWMPIEALQLGAWNTITVSIPTDAHPLYSIGLELFASAPTPGDVYLDSVDYGSTPDTAQYNFESGTQNWRSDDDPYNPTVTIATSAAQHFAGRKSLELGVNHIGVARVFVDHPSVHAGDTVTFRVFIPTGASVDSIQPFAIEGEAGNWAWHGNWKPASALDAGAWNTVTVDIPANAEAVAALGIELSISQPNAGNVYVDSVGF